MLPNLYKMSLVEAKRKSQGNEWQYSGFYGSAFNKLEKRISDVADIPRTSQMLPTSRERVRHNEVQDLLTYSILIKEYMWVFSCHPEWSGGMLALPIEWDDTIRQNVIAIKEKYRRAKWMFGEHICGSSNCFLNNVSIFSTTEEFSLPTSAIRYFLAQIKTIVSKNTGPLAPLNLPEKVGIRVSAIKSTYDKKETVHKLRAEVA